MLARRKIVRVGLLCLLASLVASSSAARSKPNIVLVFMDNFGWGEPGFNGGGIIRGAPTPRIDKLASEGIRLTNCYAAAANCSPARTGLMTGRTPYRVGTHNWIPMFSPMHVRRTEITVATLLRQNGYDL